jgi:hypothetical protein
MADTPQRLAERLQTDGEKTAMFFHALLPDDWTHPVYTIGGQWAIHQVLAHFVSAEASFVELIDNINQGGQGVPEGFDIDAFNEDQVADLASSTPDHLLERFIYLRQLTVQLVGGLSQKDLEKTGRHPFLGVVPLEDIIKLIYRHNQIHLRDLRPILEAE